MRIALALPLAVLLTIGLAEAAPAALPLVAPASVGMSAEVLARIDAAVSESIARKDAPGAVVLVGRKGRVVFRKAYGQRALVPGPEPMTVDTVFDLASLTKVVATATSVMTLVEAGKVRLEDPVARHLPDFAAGGGGRADVTVEQLLTHRARPRRRTTRWTSTRERRPRSSPASTASPSPTSRELGSSTPTSASRCSASSSGWWPARRWIATRRARCSRRSA